MSRKHGYLDFVAFGTPLAMLAAVAAFVSCGSDGPGDPKGVFGGITENTTYTFNATTYDGIPTSLVSGRVGETEVNGRTFPVYQIKKTAVGSDDGIKVYADWQPDKVIFGGGQIFYGDNGVTAPNEPFITGTTDSPVTFNINTPVGEVNTVPVKGTAYVGDPTNPANLHTVDVTATYKLEEDDVTVDTAIGTLSGCKKFSGSTEYNGQIFNGVVYYHPDHGLVKGSVDWPPPNGSTLDMSGIFDIGENQGGYNTIRMMTVIDSVYSSMSLNSFDVNGALDADEQVHGQMLLELRMADDLLAMDPYTQPQVNIQFGNDRYNYSDYYMQESPVSFFHPEENGKGYRFWWAFVSSADKYRESRGMSYHISVSLTDSTVPPVQVTARIIYKML